MRFRWLRRPPNAEVIKQESSGDYITGYVPELQRVALTAAVRSVFNVTKFSHTTRLLRNLHRLPVAARIQSESLTLALNAKIGLAPPYLLALIKQRHSSSSQRYQQCLS